MASPVVERRGVSQDVPLLPFTLDKTTTAAQTLGNAAAVPGRRYRVRGFMISSEGTEVTTARILGTIEGVSTILAHQSTDDQVGSVVMLPGFIELDVNTPIQAELSDASTNGVLFAVYAEAVSG